MRNSDPKHTQKVCFLFSGPRPRQRVFAGGQVMEVIVVGVGADGQPSTHEHKKRNKERKLQDTKGEEGEEMRMCLNDQL